MSDDKSVHSSQSETPVDPLKVSVDISDKVLQVRIGRPKRRNALERGSAELARATAPDASPEEIQLETQPYVRNGIKESDFADEESFAKAISGIDWGEYDPEKIIEVIYKITEIISGVSFLPYQAPFVRRVIRAIIFNEGETITASWSRQSGKSVSIAAIAVALCAAMPALAKQFPEQLKIYKDGFFVGIFAPAAEQALRLYNKVQKFARSQSAFDIYDDEDFQIKLERYGCKWSNGSSVIAQSANPKSNIEGPSLHLGISDESQDLIGAVAAKSIEPMLSWTNGTMVYTGTAADDPNYFYDLKLSNSQFDLSRPEKFRTCFEYTYEEIIKHNPRYAKFVEQQIRKHGKESRAFQRAFMLRWGFEEGKAIPPSVLKEHTMYHRVPISHISDEPVVVGIDLARKRYGTVVTVSKVVRMDVIYEDDDASGAIKKNLPTAQICDWLELEDMPYPDQRPLMRAFLNQYSNVRMIVVDSTGVGDAVLEEMGREWDEYRSILTPFLFSPKSKNQLMNLFYEFLYSRRLIIPSTDEARELTRWQKFFLQMVNIQKISKAGYTFLSKASRESARDDFVDSLLLCLHGVQINSSRLGDDITLDSESIFTSSVGESGTGIEAMRRRYQEGQSVSLSQRNARAQKLLGGIK